jgi:hypothetical protein
MPGVPSCDACDTGCVVFAAQAGTLESAVRQLEAFVASLGGTVCVVAHGNWDLGVQARHLPTRQPRVSTA